MTSSLKSRFDRLPRRAILLGSEKLSVYHWLKGRITNSYMFDTDEVGQEQFERYLQNSAASPVYILADFAEEEFRSETIPHVFGADRRAIIQRKQNRLFRDATYCYSWVQGREAEGRRDDRILLTSITNPGLLKPWLVMLEKYNVPVASVSSVAIFTQELLELLPEPTGNMLVVTLQSISGLRQSFYSGGELKISRSIKMPRYGTASYAPFIAEEIEKIRRYLSSLRFISNDEPLDVYFLTHGELLTELESDLVDSELHRYHILDLQEVANESSMGVQITTPFSDQLLVHEVLRRKPENHYAKVRDLRYFAMRKLRYGLYAASVLILLSSLIFTGMSLMDSIDYKQQSIAAVKKTRFYNDRYEMAREGLPDTPVEPRDLQTLAKIEDELQRYRTTPLPMLKVISNGLNRFPVVVLDGLRWVQSPDPNLDIGDASPPSNAPPPAPVSGMPGSPPMTLEQPQENLYYQVAELNARIDDFDGNYRKAISTINSFAEVLRSQDDVVNVTVTSLPLNISSDSSLQGNMIVTEKEALFSMKIALGVKEDESG